MSHDTEETEADWIINDRQFCANEIFKILAAGQLLEEGWWIITRSCFLSIHWSVTVGYFHSYPIMRESWRSPRFFLFLSSFLKEIKQTVQHTQYRTPNKQEERWLKDRKTDVCILFSDEQEEAQETRTAALTQLMLEVKVTTLPAHVIAHTLYTHLWNKPFHIFLQ